jgi:N-acylglucosamine 2-epimerase/mannose-6-phosphate isomerase
MNTIPFAEIRAWMFDKALPLWGSAGLDHEHGGFLEELDLAGRPTDVAFKRVRVTCRQIYVFSHASLLGWAQGSALAARGYAYLIEQAWQGPDKGWAKVLTRAGDVLDPTPDLYDQAFTLFSLAWRYRESRDPDALQRAHDTLDFIQRHMRPESGEGFWHQLPPTGPRVQNPHMHLLEASLAAFEATEDERFLEQAREVVELFQARFFDGRTLGEYFTEDWRRVPGEQGRVTEPGHQLEWAWILAQYQRLTGEDVSREAEALVAFAERHGVDPASHATFNQVRDDGAPIDPASRTWPNTERVKAHVALYELLGRDPTVPVTQSTRLLLDRYLNATPPGSWIDNFDALGRPLAKTAPTSTLYHVFLAFAEVLRLEGRLVKAR